MSEHVSRLHCAQAEAFGRLNVFVLRISDESAACDERLIASKRKQYSLNIDLATWFGGQGAERCVWALREIENFAPGKHLRSKEQ